MYVHLGLNSKAMGPVIRGTISKTQEIGTKQIIQSEKNFYENSNGSNHQKVKALKKKYMSALLITAFI